jgi:uncharacterized lipoprotein YddW (UPF0748 family)
MRLFLLVLSLSCGLYGASISSTTTGGNWSATTTWTGGVVPGSGDIVTILGTVHVDSDRTAGNDSAVAEKDTTHYALLISYTNTTTNKGELIVDAGVTLTCRGDIRMVAGNTVDVYPLFQMNPGSKLIFDSSAHASPDLYHYRIYSGNPGGSYRQNRIRVLGTSGSHAVFDTNTTSRTSPNGIMNAHSFIEQTAGTTNGFVDIVIQYMDIEDCGSQNIGCILAGPSGTVVPSTFQMEHVTMTRTAGIKCVSTTGCSYPSADASFIIRDLKMYSTTTVGSAAGYTDARTKFSLNFTVPSTKGLGTREITDAYFDAGASTGNNGWPGFVLTNVVYEIDPPTYPATTDATKTGQQTNVVYRAVNVDGNGHNLGGSATNLYYFMESSAATGNPHGLKAGVRGDQTIDGAIFEYGFTSAADGNIYTAAATSAGASNFTHTLKNSIVTPVTGGTGIPTTSGGNLGNYGNATDSPVLPDTVIHSHNTFFIFGSGPSGTTYFGENMSSCSKTHYGANSVDVYRDNIAFGLGGSPSANGHWEINECPTTAPPNLVNPAGTDHNACYNCTLTTGSKWTTANATNCPVTCTSNNTFYDLPMTGTTPGTGDLSGDPGFVDITRSFRRWCDYTTSQAPNTCTGQDAARLLRDGPGTMQSKIDSLFAWVRDGFRPTNETYRTAASDGTTIGAVAMTTVTPPPTVSYAPVRSAIQEPKQRAEIRGSMANAQYSQATIDLMIAVAKNSHQNMISMQDHPDRYSAHRLCQIDPPSPNLPTGSFDPIAYFIQAANAAKIKPFLWDAQTFFMYNYAQDALRPTTHVWKLHGLSKQGTVDDWITYPADGSNPPASDTSGQHKLHMDPGHPDAARYIADDTVNVFKCYPGAAGAVMDYIRYPYQNATGQRYGYNPENIRRYNRRYSLTGTPADNSAQWEDWRRLQVQLLVRQIFYRLKEINPALMLTGTTVLWGDYSGGVPHGIDGHNFSTTDHWSVGFVDWDKWCQLGIIDFVMPMIYRHETNASSSANMTSWYNWMDDHKHGREYAPTLGSYLNTPADNLFQMDKTVGFGFAGYDVFRYAQSADSGQSTDSFAAWRHSRTSFPNFPWIVPTTLGWLLGDVTTPDDGYLKDGLTVEVFDGSTVIATDITDGSGFYGFTVAPGVYTIRFRNFAGTIIQTSPSVTVIASRAVRMNQTINGVSVRAPRRPGTRKSRFPPYRVHLEEPYYLPGQTSF